MATRLKLVFRGKTRSFFEPLRGQIVLGDHGCTKNDDHCLSNDCATIEEFAEEVASLKAQLDKLLRKAEARFSAKRKAK